MSNLKYMNKQELEKLQKKINLLHILNIIFWIINALLIIIPIWHYYKIAFKFDFDNYFLVITILNILGFYISMKVTEKLVFFKKKHLHFSDKQNLNT